MRVQSVDRGLGSNGTGNRLKHLARDLFHGKRGELHQRYREGQEDQLSALGLSEIVFGLFWLLGFQFSPRLADIGGTRFWRIDPQTDYGVLDRISRHLVNTNRIRRHWDDMLRVAGSLKRGTVSASELMRSLLNTERPSMLARAIADLGRIPKTLHLLRLIDDEGYRRSILTQLNHVSKTSP